MKDSYERTGKAHVANKIPEDSIMIDAKGKYDPIGRHLAVSQTYKLQDLKAKSKRYGVSLNTYLAGLFTKAIYDYTDGKEPSPCTVLIAGSTRKPFKTFDEFTCDN